MNYLAHLYLADLNSDSLTGHFLGDFVKGRQLGRYSQELQAAILFHRKIDSFTDAHPVIQTSRNRFKPPWRRFAGVIVDVCGDHFLARHWNTYHHAPLPDFARRVYAQLDRDRALLTEQSAFVLSRMITHDWLGSYFHLKNVGLALDRIAGRLSRGSAFMGSLNQIEAQYIDLRMDFQAFFPELIDFSRRYCQQREGAVYRRS